MDTLDRKSKIERAAQFILEQEPAVAKLRVEELLWLEIEKRGDR